MDASFIEKIFSGEAVSLQQILKVFRLQHANNQVYRTWCDCLKTNISEINAVEKIPFLPISFFKTQEVVCGNFQPELIFESSGTTQTSNSRHYVKYANIYEESFVKSFQQFYGNIDEYCILGLLPNYLEKGNSSLIKMTEGFIKRSRCAESGFYLYDFDKLRATLQTLESRRQKTLLLGVTFALLDFAEQFSLNLQHTIVMDTGGMKGRKKEMTRNEVHEFLQKKLGVKTIHSEYGMTELLSQAYSQGEGKYVCPPWMQVLARDENDPLLLSRTGKGLLNIIDLANVYSCSFIATDDVGSIGENYFEIWGRRDYSDLRGCNLLVV